MSEYASRQNRPIRVKAVPVDPVLPGGHFVCGYHLTIAEYTLILIREAEAPSADGIPPVRATGNPQQLRDLEVQRRAAEYERTGVPGRWQRNA